MPNLEIDTNQVVHTTIRFGDGNFTASLSSANIPSIFGDSDSTVKMNVTTYHAVLGLAYHIYRV